MQLTLKNKKDERFLLYAQSYTFSAIRLLETHNKKTGIATRPFHFKVKKEDIILPSLFLMAHGAELFLKIFIKILSGNYPKAQHGYNLLKELERYDKKLLFSHRKKIKELLFFYEKTRYPYNKNFDKCILEFNKFLRYWTQEKVNKYLITFKEIRDLLNTASSRLMR